MKVVKLAATGGKVSRTEAESLEGKNLLNSCLVPYSIKFLGPKINLTGLAVYQGLEDYDSKNRD